MSILIRQAQNTDWPQIWRIIEPALRTGETYSYPRDISESEAKQAWLATPEAPYVATDESSEVVGTYYIKPNQPGQGKHVCNCGYIVGAKARGRGVASQMCRHSQEIAIERGFTSMQFNLVVSTNEVAVTLWKKLGFEIVGTLPGAFNHPALGFVDAYVMFKRLECAA